MTAENSRYTISRRRALQAGTGAAAAIALTPRGHVLAAGSEVTLRQGTNICAAAAPDGRIAFDLVSAIWVLDPGGGSARRITDELQDATQPDFSPDGRSLVFQSYRDGNFHLWTMSADGSALRQLTAGGHDHREPRFSPDGRTLAFTSDRAGGYQVFVMDLASGVLSQVTRDRPDVSMPSWSPDGGALVYVAGDTAIERIELASGRISTVVDGGDESTLYGPSLGPDGRLAHVRLVGSRRDLVVGESTVTEGEDVFGFAPRWTGPGELLYTADGVVRRRGLAGGRSEVPFTAAVPVLARRDFPQRRPGVRGPEVTGIASPVCSADGQHVAFRALNALWVMPIGGEPRKVVGDGYFASDPDFSPDGRQLLHSSDRAGTADLWLHDLTTGAERRITDVEGAAITARFAPDGRRIAYQDEDGATWIADLGGGEPRRLTSPLFQPGRPDWSPDGRTLVLAAVKPYGTRFREGTSQVLRVDVETGALHYTEVMPFRSLATRGDDGPVWSPDGRHLAFVVESTAWIVPVDAVGAFTGAPRQVTTELTDSLSWRDAEHLLFLNGGELRSAHIGTGEVSAIPLDLRWSPPEVVENRIVRAGAMWDGVSPQLRRDVDIVLAGERIAAVLPAQDGRADLDARELTAMPGLIDAHVHWHLRGRQWGDRQGRAWLAYGITTTRSPGDPAYQMQETREALTSGDRVGPRLFGTGEAIDGGRTYYNFMRCTRSEQQLALEMQRVAALDYDMVKTYVRLPVGLQRAAIAQAHAQGRPLSSHYVYPAANLGMDGMEHTGATNRLGYSHTCDDLGNSYDDAVSLFAASGMSLTPTLFSSSGLYAADRSLIEDRRTRVLFPPWEYQRLLGEAEDAAGPDGVIRRAQLAGQVDMLLRIQRRGGFIIAGTDSPLDNIAVSLHMNLRAMVAHGFTPQEALTTATRNPARWLGLAGELGEIREGAYADLVLVAGDPLADIAAAAAVRTVIRGGLVHTPDSLLAPFESPGSVSAAAVTGTHRARPEHDAAYWWHEPEWAHRACCEHPRFT